MRILGIDYGDRRIGIAISDPINVTAQGIGIIENINTHQVIEKINELTTKHNVTKIVVGIPLNMNGSIGARAKLTLEFVDALKKEIDVGIDTFDERLSTRFAERQMLRADLSRKRRKKNIDIISAQIILQDYLDSIKD